jgi:hypothetical protein
MLAQKLALSLPTIKNVAGDFNLYALDFDGTNDYVQFGDSDAFTPNSSGGNRGFSVSFWCKNSATRVGIISKADAGKMEWEILLGTGGIITWSVYANADSANYQKLQTTTSVGDGAWHNVICSFNLADADSSLILFIDGVKHSDAIGNAAYISGGTWTSVTNTLATMLLGDIYGANPYPGLIDEVAIFDDVTTQVQATAIYNSGTPTDLSGETYLFGYWRNGDTAGTSVYPTIEDYSVKSNDGTMTNMASGDIVTDAP